LFLKAPLILSEWPAAVGVLGSRPCLADHQKHATYDTHNLEFMSGLDVGFASDDDIYVIPNVVHSNGVIVAARTPLRFEDFAIGMLATHRVASGEPKRQRLVLPASAIAKLRELYPWLTDTDISEAHMPASSSGGAGGGTREPQHLTDEDFEEALLTDVLEILDAKREKWHFEEEGVTEYFYIHRRQGIWTRKFKGVDSDCLMCKGRSLTTNFCNRFGWPKTKTYTYKTYGQAECYVLGKELCRKGSYYFRVWVDSGEDEQFADEASLDYVPSDEFRSWVKTVPVDACKHSLSALVSELLALRPIIQ
jgi:hypothetical protein